MKKTHQIKDPLKPGLPIEKKREYIQVNFSEIARHYDLFNDLVSLGLHRLWKRKTIRLSGLSQSRTQQTRNAQPCQVMDLCCGTGDISFCLEKMLPPGSHIDAIDFSREMLDIMEKRRQNHRNNKRIPKKATHPQAATTDKNKKKKTNLLLHHVAFEELPLQPEHYDGIFISFGLRNLTNIPRSLDKIYQLLKKTGVLLILDFNRATPSPSINSLFQFYLHSIVPKVGWILQGRKHIMYHYLAKSVQHFFLPSELICNLKNAGFCKISYQKNLFGQTGIYVAYKT